MHNSRLNRYGRVENVRSFSAAERLAKRTKRVGECLIWQGYCQPSGYGQTGHNGEVEQVHRVAWWEAGKGDIPEGLMLDHICHNKSCCEVTHLRIVTRKQNAENIAKLPSNNKSGYRGVSYYKRDGTWTAQMGHNGGNLYLGRYSTPEEAHAVALAKRLELQTHNDIDRVA